MTSEAAVSLIVIAGVLGLVSAAGLLAYGVDDSGPLLSFLIVAIVVIIYAAIQL